MNLCFINPSKSWRPEIYELAKHLPNKYSITILQPSNRAEWGKVFRLRENIYVKYAPSIFTPLHDSIVTIPFLKKWAELLLDLIQRERCELIHVCDYEYLTSIIPILIKRTYGSFQTVIVNDALIGVENYSFGSQLMDMLSKVYTHTIGLRILKSYDKVVFLYTELAKVAKALGLREEKLEIIPNGIDVKKMLAFQKYCDTENIKEKFGITKDEKIILYVGRLVKVKRVELILEVVKKLINQGFNVKALIVGDGPQSTKLQKISYPIRQNVIFTGYLLGKDKYECYSIANLFILPSLSEGLPTVLLEAASFRLPIVATNTNGVPDIVIHGETGFLADKWNYGQYINYARLILMDDSLARMLGENARRHVENNFSWNVIAEKYEKLYRDLFA